MTRVATAPGKLHIAGEYAVLDGAEAVLVAVNRRAVAREVDVALADPSPFLAAVAATIVAARGDGVQAERARRLVVDTTALHHDGQKLGLGSSAATTVAATALAIADAAGRVSREEVHALARAAHARAQGARGARGSGADVAVAVHGGAIGVTPSAREGDRPAVRRLALPDGVALVTFWTGRPADTASLVAAVGARIGRPGVAAAITQIADASEALAGAMEPGRGRAAAAIAAIAAGAEAIAELARVTGVDLVPPALAVAERLAAAAGGAAKTTGAAGGDVAIIAVPAAADIERLRADLAAAGATPLDLRIDPLGVDIQDSAG